jgi:hypothetical protein
MKNLTRNYPKYNCIQPSTEKEIFFRPFLVSDEKNLLLIKEEKNSNLIIKNVVSLLVNCFDNLNEETMTLQDLEALFCNLRAKSVGEIVKTSFVCPETKEQISGELDISKMLFSQKNKLFELNIDNNFKIIFKEPTIQKILEVSGEFDVKHLIKASLEKIIKHDSVYDRYDLSNDEIEKILADLTVKEYSEIKKFISELPKTYFIIEYTTSDGVQRKTKLDGFLNFFIFS